LSAPPALADPYVAVGMAKAVDALRYAGATVTKEAPEIPDASMSLATVAATEEAAVYGPLAEGHTADLSEYAQRSLLRGAGAKGAAVAEAYRRIDQLSRIMEHFFDRYDGLVQPTMPTTAHVNRARVTQTSGETVNPWLISTLYTPLANLIQAPASAVPTAVDGENLPTSVEGLVRPGNEVTMLHCAVVLEQALPWLDRYPMLRHGDSRPGISVSCSGVPTPRSPELTSTLSCEFSIHETCLMLSRKPTDGWMPVARPGPE